MRFFDAFFVGLLLVLLVSACLGAPEMAGFYKSGAYAGCMRASGELFGPMDSAQIIEFDRMCDEIVAGLSGERE